jgi:hypothetical protein
MALRLTGDDVLGLNGRRAVHVEGTYSGEVAIRTFAYTGGGGYEVHTVVVAPGDLPELIAQLTAAMSPTGAS